MVHNLHLVSSVIWVLILAVLIMRDVKPGFWWVLVATAAASVFALSYNWHNKKLLVPVEGVAT